MKSVAEISGTQPPRGECDLRGSRSHVVAHVGMYLLTLDCARAIYTTLDGT